MLSQIGCVSLPPSTVEKLYQGQQLTEKTLFTHFAQMIGTPLYMSPEQAEMNELVWTRAATFTPWG